MEHYGAAAAAHDEEIANTEPQNLTIPSDIAQEVQVKKASSAAKEQSVADTTAPTSYGDDDAYPDLLQHLLSSLALLPDVVDLLEVIATESCGDSLGSSPLTLPEVIWDVWKTQQQTDAVTDIVNDNDTESERQQQQQQHNVANKGDAGYEWRQGWQALGSLIQEIPALELHSVAVQAIVFSESTRGIMYTTTCLLLCVAALYQCPGPTITVKRKRWLSVLFETCRLFQRHYEVATSPDGLGTVKRVFGPLWTRHLVPAIRHVQDALLLGTLLDTGTDNNDNGSHSTDNHSKHNDLRWVSPAVLCGVVCTTARLGGALFDSDNHALSDACGAEPALFAHVVGLLLPVLHNVLEGRLEHICLHSWRPALLTDALAARPLSTLSPAAAFVVWTMEQDQGDGQDDSGDDEDERSIAVLQRREMVSHMETVWDDVGIAVLSAVGLEVARPLVWSSNYAWRLGFPHVDVLLNSNDAKQLQLLGFRLLRTLLAIAPAQSLPTPKANYPDSPIGTLQLVSNRIVAGASADGQRSTPSRVEVDLPDATRAFSLMKQVVSKYNPVDQVVIVRQLVQDCPHPGLKPKLLDLLRVFVAWDTECKAMSDAWAYLDSFVVDLEDIVETKESGEMVLRDAGDLVDGVEVYVSAFGLLHLWMLMKRTATGIVDAASRLEIIHNAVRTTLSHWETRNGGMGAPPDQHFRLNLLESSLRNAIVEITHG